MGRGGRREGAGRKSYWRSPTKMMRLPAEYEHQIVEYAKQLDSEAESAELNLAALQGHVEAVLLSLRPGDRRAAAKLFNKLLARLEG